MATRRGRLAWFGSNPDTLASLPAVLEMYAAQDEILTKRYQMVYIEKCKKIKAIEMASKECRSLQREIHGLLDVLAEVIPAEEILESPYWSGSEEEDDDAEDLLMHNHDRFFLNYDPLSEDDIDSEADELAKLQLEYDELVKKSTNKRLSSPSKGGDGTMPAPKARRSYKYLPLNEAGEVELPLTLGRGPNRINVSKIGPIVQIEDEAGEGLMPVPLDYESKRKYFDLSQASEPDGKKQAYYICTITSSDGKKPRYRISLADTEISIESDSIVDLWTQFRSKFPESLLAQFDEDFSHPRIFFGLEHDNLAKYFKDLLAQQAAASSTI